MAYKKKSSKPVVVHNHITTGSSNTKRVLLIVTILLLAVFLVVGAVSYLNNKNVNPGDIVYIDKTQEGNVDISFGDNGDIVVKDEENSKSDVYFAGLQANFLNIREQHTFRYSSSKYSYTNYELELMAYSDSECTELIRYVISFGDEFEIYQIIEQRNPLKGSYLKALEDNDNLSSFFAGATHYMLNRSDTVEEKGITYKGLNTFEMCNALYFNNGDYKLELTASKNLLEVFTNLIKSSIKSQDSESMNSQINLSLDIDELFNAKIFNDSANEYQVVTNNVCLNASVLKFKRVANNGEVVYLASEAFADIPLFITIDGLYYDFNVVDVIGYVIKF